jgi:hypothetical protein
MFTSLVVVGRFLAMSNEPIFRASIVLEEFEDDQDNIHVTITFEPDLPENLSAEDMPESHRIIQSIHDKVLVPLLDGNPISVERDSFPPPGSLN